MEKKITFIGGGVIGAGLAVNAAMHDFKVWIYDIRTVEEISPAVKDILSIFVTNEVCTAEQADSYFENISFTTDLKEAVEDAPFIQECIAERIELKQGMYRSIQEIAGDKPIIASTTSMLLPSDLQKDALYPERILVGHPYNPSYLLPLIEVCGGEKTSEESVQEAKAYYEEIGKKPIICHKEKFGLIANMVSWAALDAAKKAIVDGVCSVDEMDQALMYGPGLRMAITGQILTISMGVKGGLRAMGDKYGKSNPVDLILADGCDEELANRPAELGQDYESVAAFRDRLIIKILKEQKVM